MSDKNLYENLTQLGSGKTTLPSNPDEAVLESVANPHSDVDYAVRFSCPEFTSLCPLTGQPDFAHLVIDYVPNAHLLESKSLKLYLSSYRNHGDFHEACTISIAKRICGTVSPNGCGLVGIGILVVESRLIYFIKQLSHLLGCGFLTLVLIITVGGRYVKKT